MRNSEDFIHILVILWANPKDILISFEVVSSFIKMLIRDDFDILH
jgi:hypothetical protein